LVTLTQVLLPRQDVPRRILITGASGFLGWHLCRLAARHWQVLAVGHRHRVGVDGVATIQCDLADPGACNAALAAAKPQAIVHAAALSQPNRCEEAPGQAFGVNVDATVQVAEFCRAKGIPMVFASTDLVFDGSKAPYAETDPVSPICVYGRQKSLAESRIRQVCPQSTICRLPLLFGFTPSAPSRGSGELLHGLKNGDPLELFVDEIRTPVDVTSAARGLLWALAHPSQLFHLGGDRRISRYAMGRMLADQMNLKAACIAPVRLFQSNMPAPRSPDVSLNSTRARDLGYQPTELASALAATVAAFERPADQHGKSL
jgi:dTDP-4-dehydrorhamnose reductase